MTEEQQSAMLAIAGEFGVEASAYDGEYSAYDVAATLAVVVADRRIVDVMTGIMAARAGRRSLSGSCRIELFRLDRLGRDWVAY